MRLQNKTAIITGGSNGIGLETAKLFATEGSNVIITDIQEPKETFDNITFYKLDVTDEIGCENFAKEVMSKQNIDILVNNAGITQDALTKKMTTQQWTQVLNINLTGVFNLTRHIGPHMQANNQGSIINISSVVGEFGNIGQANYAATKAGVIGLTKSWAKEFAMKNANVRVNAIAPGYIMTDILKTVPQDLLDKFAGLTALGRLGEPQEIAKSILFLASDDASYITGHTLSVNGGMRL